MLSVVTPPPHHKESVKMVWTSGKDACQTSRCLGAFSWLQITFDNQQTQTIIYFLNIFFLLKQQMTVYHRHIAVALFWFTCTNACNREHYSLSLLACIQMYTITKKHKTQHHTTTKTQASRSESATSATTRSQTALYFCWQFGNSAASSWGESEHSANVKIEEMLV